MASTWATNSTNSKNLTTTTTTTTTSSTSSTSSRRTVHLIGSWAPLLSGVDGSLEACQTADDDETCVGGVAAVAAYARHNVPRNESSLVLPLLDKSSPFVQMHPLGWAVNRLVLQHILGWGKNNKNASSSSSSCFVSMPSLLTQVDNNNNNIKNNNKINNNQNRRDYIADLQTTDWPLLLTNVAVPPSNHWMLYTQPVHWDEVTKLAILFVANNNHALNVPQIEATSTMLDIVARRNAQNKCHRTRDTGDSENTTQDDTNNESSSSSSLFDSYISTITITKNNSTSGNSTTKTPLCWIPVIFYADVAEQFEPFLQAMMEHDHPPALILDLEGNSPPYDIPRRVGSNNNIWLISYFMSGSDYRQHVITIDDNDSSVVTNVTMIYKDLTAAPLPEMYKDEEYRGHIASLRLLASEAATNNPRVGATSTDMPATRVGNYRRCKAGECESGNLFNDAARWWYDTTSASNANAGTTSTSSLNKTLDNVVVAFSNSGGYRGPGWPAGPVHVNDIWATLPFDNLLCTGKMTGISLFRLFNYSISVATFEGENTSDGDRLLQVSGMRVTYNTNLPITSSSSNASSSNTTRLVALDVWNETAQSYVPIQRLELYTFVTDSYMCGSFEPFNQLLGKEMLVIPGEEPGVIHDGDLLQNIVGDYLQQLEMPYNASIFGRLVNQTDALQPMTSFEQTADACHADEYWNASFFSCDACPFTTSTVYFLDEKLNYEDEETVVITGKTFIVNNAKFIVVVVPKSKPAWVTLTEATLESTGAMAMLGDGLPLLLEPRERVALTFTMDSSRLDPGTASGTVSFAVNDAGDHAGCAGYSDISFDVFMRVSPEAELNQLGNIRYLGWTLAAVAMCTACACVSWVLINRNLIVVKTLQPIFLVMIGVGVFVMTAALIPRSFDDEIISVSGCDIACMSVPWLFSMGFTVAMSALFSKLWRINRLFENPMMRKKVVPRDVIGPFAVLFSLNFVALLVWTLLDPLRWQRLPVDPDSSWNSWNTYGSCKAENGTVNIIMISIVACVNIMAFLVACYQAYKARNISGDFSESRSVGIALFSWFQLLVVGAPVLYAIGKTNPPARFSLEAGLIFAIGMSLLLLIFVPIMRHKVVAQNGNASNNRLSISIRDVGSTRVSGFPLAESPANRNSRMSQQSCDFSIREVEDKLSAMPSLQS
jgi:7 transmembrane sweet-taste receptor of 3 GCPR/5'-nucleotidase, C-terminal domain